MRYALIALLFVSCQRPLGGRYIMVTLKLSAPENVKALRLLVEGDGAPVEKLWTKASFSEAEEVAYYPGVDSGTLNFTGSAYADTSGDQLIAFGRGSVMAEGASVELTLEAVGANSDLVKPVEDMASASTDMASTDMAGVIPDMSVKIWKDFCVGPLGCSNDMGVGVCTIHDDGFGDKYSDCSPINEHTLLTAQHACATLILAKWNDNTEAHCMNVPGGCANCSELVGYSQPGPHNASFCSMGGVGVAGTASDSTNCPNGGQQWGGP